jgi:hypothetical protein
MSVASGSTGHWTAENQGGAAAAFGVASPEAGEPAGNTWDAMEVYFECITTCSLEDGECVTRCVEELRERA